MEALRKSLKLNPSWLIYSSYNHKIFLDEDRKGYLFFDEAGAARFIEEHPYTCFEKEDFRDDDELLSQCYSDGIVELVLSGGRREEHLIIKPGTLRRQYYNPNLNAAITLCRHCMTHNGEYLSYIAACKMIVPVKVSLAARNQIIYATAHLQGGVKNRIYIAFSDMAEYQKFAERFHGWEPLIVTFDVMCQISKEYGYMINPLGDKLILPSALMEKYNAKWKRIQKAEKAAN